MVSSTLYSHLSISTALILYRQVFSLEMFILNQARIVAFALLSELYSFFVCFPRSALLIFYRNFLVLAPQNSSCIGVYLAAFPLAQITNIGTLSASNSIGYMSTIASLASSFALSLPVIPSCPSTQQREIVTFLIFSLIFRTRLMLSLIFAPQILYNAT